MVSPVKVWRNQKKMREHLGKKGVVVSWTLIRVAPAGYEEQAPYPVVIVELTDKKKLVGQLVDWEEKNLVIGQKVEAVIRRIVHPDASGVIPYGIKFRPL